MALLGSKWPFLAILVPVLCQCSWKVLPSMGQLPFPSLWGRFLALWVRACAQFQILRRETRETPPSTVLREPVAFVLISILAFCCSNPYVHGFRRWEKVGLKARLKRKELAKSSSRWERPWFSCVLGVKVRWFSGCYSGSLDLIIVVQASFTRSFWVASTDYQRF